MHGYIYIYIYTNGILSVLIYKSPLILTIDRIEEADVKTQTDAFLDRPATPLFIPAKTGRDVATQIEDDDVCKKKKKSHISFIDLQIYFSSCSCLTSMLK